MKRILAALVLSAIALPAVAFAQRDDSTCPKPGRRNKDGVCVKEVNMGEGEKLVGRFVRPDGTVVIGIAASEHPSMIRYRDNFIDRIVASAENR
jgi:hypothetical protein